MSVSVPTTLRQSAGSADDSATTMTRHTPAPEARDITTHLPSSLSAASASQVAGTWTKKFSGCASGCEEYGDGLRLAAAQWDATDAALARNLRLVEDPAWVGV